jgi:hypothetical protein
VTPARSSKPSVSSFTTLSCAFLAQIAQHEPNMKAVVANRPFDSTVYAGGALVTGRPFVGTPASFFEETEILG